MVPTPFGPVTKACPDSAPGLRNEPTTLSCIVDVVDKGLVSGRQRVQFGHAHAIRTSNKGVVFLAGPPGLARYLSRVIDGISIALIMPG